ncbi:hypothetical protein [Streptomyces sp. BRA346]|uniref:hypothetical protein n=1 Tax=Streptomyces sp. BRA346 TaxID=2878199 RepID=UPI0040640602
MGLNLTVLMASWERLREIPVEDRTEALDDAVWPMGLDDEYCSTYGGAKSWVWPPEQDSAWCAEYHFVSTTGSYTWHSRAGDAWDDMRALADTSLREAMDHVLDGLIWNEDPAEDPTLTGGGGMFPPVTDRWRPGLLLVCPPETTLGKARSWERALPHLERLREPFAAECEGWAGRSESFEEFVTLVREWGDVITEAARRGWGLVGLQS